MSLDREALTRAAARGPFVRVLVAEAQGSTPREAGAAMLVGADWAEGTIGGGALEYEAMARARETLARGGAGRFERIALGPAMGQCCGGAVCLAYEVMTAESVAGLAPGIWARPVAGAAGPMPLGVRRALARARDRGAVPAILIEGWLLEEVAAPARALWIWGAGHVGRALVSVLAPLPGLAICWADSGAERFPAAIPPGVTPMIAANPAELVALAPRDAHHLVLTYSHALDLELCHRLLGHGFDSLGLIGSATKWARFRARLAGLGHDGAQISRIACPIGDPTLGKHPQAIAVGVASALIRGMSAGARPRQKKDRAG